MDNQAFQKAPETQIQMKETAVQQPSTATTSTNTGAKICRPDVCRRARMKYTRERENAESPWHRKKTIMLIIFICLLGCWAVVYGVLTKMDLL